MPRFVHSFSSEYAKPRREHIERALKRRAMTIAELSKEVGICNEQASTYIKHYRSLNQVHIFKWIVSDGGKLRRWHAAYIWGDGDDAKKPAPFDRSSRRVHAAKKQSTRCDPMVAALFGQ